MINDSARPVTAYCSCGEVIFGTDYGVWLHVGTLTMAHLGPVTPIGEDS